MIYNLPASGRFASRRSINPLVVLISCLLALTVSECIESANHCEASTARTQSKMADPANYKALRKDLLELYTKCVEGRDESAASFVKQLTEKVLEDCEKEGIVKDKFFAGSHYEKLSVATSSDYDIIIYLNHGTKWKVVPHPSDVDFVALESDGSVNGNGFTVRSKTVVQEHKEYMSALQARKMLQGYVDQTLQKWHRKKIDGYEFKVTRKQGGPAVTLSVTDHPRLGTLEMDLVVGVRLEDGTSYVAKPIEKTKPEKDPKYWRKSFAEDERRYLNSIDAGNKIARKVVRLVKAIKLHQPQFRAFPSYVYKNVLLGMMDDKALDWSEQYLAQRFVDYIDTLQARLEAGKVPIYFNKKSNILKPKHKSSAEQLSQFLKRLKNKEKLEGYRELVQATVNKL